MQKLTDCLMNYIYVQQCQSSHYLIVIMKVQLSKNKQKLKILKSLNNAIKLLKNSGIKPLHSWRKSGRRMDGLPSPSQSPLDQKKIPFNPIQSSCL